MYYIRNRILKNAYSKFELNYLISKLIHSFVQMPMILKKNLYISFLRKEEKN